MLVLDLKMQAAERQQLENINSIHASASKLKHKLQDLLIMIEYQVYIQCHNNVYFRERLAIGLSI